MSKKTSKKNLSKKNLSKKNSNSSNKISITIDFTKEDKGYRDFLNPKLLEFIERNIKKGNNLIQTQDNKPFYVNKKCRLHLQAVPFKKWKLNPEWNNIDNDLESIQCKKYNDFIKTSPCKIGKNLKVFVKLKSNTLMAGLTNYILALHTKLLTEKNHISFVNSLSETMKDKPIIVNNEDVTWFHLKSLVK
tara:strand:- start:1881 stop:2450 length:570 start_codon:yes stop_codon:yes gene_type:complete